MPWLTSGDDMQTLSTLQDYLSTADSWLQPKTERERILMEHAWASAMLEAATYIRDEEVRITKHVTEVMAP